MIETPMCRKDCSVGPVAKFRGHCSVFPICLERVVGGLPAAIRNRTTDQNEESGVVQFTSNANQVEVDAIHLVYQN
jgi:hypothetical protein